MRARLLLQLSHNLLVNISHDELRHGTFI